MDRHDGNGSPEQHGGLERGGLKRLKPLPPRLPLRNPLGESPEPQGASETRAEVTRQGIESQTSLRDMSIRFAAHEVPLPGSMQDHAEFDIKKDTIDSDDQETGGRSNDALARYTTHPQRGSLPPRLSLRKQDKPISPAATDDAKENEERLEEWPTEEQVELFVDRTHMLHLQVEILKSQTFDNSYSNFKGS